MAQMKARDILRGAPIEVEVMIFSRDGKQLARTGWK